MQIGKKYGKLTAIKFIRSDKYYQKYWLFKCDCGKKIIKRADKIRYGIGTSCGCEDKRLESITTHGLSHTIEWKRWQSIVQRCNNKNNYSYDNYGGMGIKVCKRWMKFENFYKDMGDKPRGKSIDRINNDGDYKPSNCRWATKKQQANNKRNNIFVSINGVQVTFTDLAEFFNIHYCTLFQRIFKQKLNLDKALTKR